MKMKNRVIDFFLLYIGPILISLFVTYLLFGNYLRSYEVGLAKNFVTKEVWLQEGKGFHLSNPLVVVVRIDTRPIRVGVHSGSKTSNMKLVQFVPEHWEEFVKTEGWRYYWWDNRFSFNCSYPEEYRGWRDVCRGYAYSNKPYPFFKVLGETGEAK